MNSYEWEGVGRALIVNMHAWACTIASQRDACIDKRFGFPACAAFIHHKHVVTRCCRPASKTCMSLKECASMSKGEPVSPEKTVYVNKITLFLLSTASLVIIAIEQNVFWHPCCSPSHVKFSKCWPKVAHAPVTWACPDLQHESLIHICMHAWAAKSWHDIQLTAFDRIMHAFWPRQTNKSVDPFFCNTPILIIITMPSAINALAAPRHTVCQEYHYRQQRILSTIFVLMCSLVKSCSVHFLSCIARTTWSCSNCVAAATLQIRAGHASLISCIAQTARNCSNGVAAATSQLWSLHAFLNMSKSSICQSQNLMQAKVGSMSF